MEIAPTLALIALGAALSVVFGWRGAQTWTPPKPPRLFPWRLAMAVSATLTLFMLVHLAHLLGLPPAA